MIKRDEVFVIGGGDSLRGFSFEKLRDKETVAVNMAAFDVPNPTYCITADSSIFRKLQEGYFKEIKTTWILVTNPNHCTMKMKDGRFINEHSGFVYDLFAVNIVIKNNDVEGIGFEFNDFKTGYNSGFCGFQLAILLGYKKINLLGFDLMAGNKCHYHNRYRGRRISESDLDKYYDNFVIALKEVKERTDIQVISRSSVSRLNKIIPYESLDLI